MDAARGAGLAVHAAAGLSAGVSREATRLLRAAEGLCRAAIASLTVVSLAPDALPHAADAGAPQRRRRPRARRHRAGGDHDQESAKAVVPCEPTAAPAEAAADLPAVPLVHPVFVAAAGGTMKFISRDHVAPQGQAPGHLDSGAAASSEAAPGQQQPVGTLDPAIDSGGMDVDLSSVGTASSRGPLKACSCGYNEPVSRKRRCIGCQWVYSATAFRKLRDFSFAADAQPARA